MICIYNTKLKNKFIFLCEDKPNLKFDIGEVSSYRVLNLFSDASTTQKKGNQPVFCCFGALAVNRDRIIDKLVMIYDNSTVIAGELNGFKIALCLALRYANQYDKINIFSDSLFTVETFRRYIYNYRYRNGNLYKSSGEAISNQSVIVECMDLLQQLLIINPNVRIFHQSGHVTIDKYESIAIAGSKFRELNNISIPLDLNVTRYISYYNNCIDNLTRAYLYKYYQSRVYTCPVEFYPNHGY